MVSDFRAALDAAGFNIVLEAINLYQAPATLNRPELRLRILTLLAEYSQTKPQAPKEDDKEASADRPFKDLTGAQLQALLKFL